MKDLREKNTNVIKGRNILGGYQVNEESVKEMLSELGVNPTEDIVQEAIGYISKYSMELNMINLSDFLKSKSIIKDLRKK
jgi:hypothetical protein